MKLETLTPEQEKLMETVKDEWIKLSLYSGSTIDKKTATESISWLYERSKLKKPVVVFVDSPLGVQYGTTLGKELINSLSKQAQVRDQVRAQVGNQVWNQVGDQVWNQVWNQVGAQVGDQVWNQVGNQVGNQVRDQVRDQVGAQVGDQVGDQVWNQVRAQVGAQVWNQVWNQVGNQVWNQVGDQVWDQVRAQVRDQVGAQVGDQVWNQVGDQVGDQVRDQKFPYNQPAYEDLGWTAGWGAWAEFYEKIGIIKHDDFKKYKKFLKSGVFYSVFLDGLAVVCGCPSFVARDAENNLHNDNRSAIAWPDGFELFYLQGEHFDKELWTKIISQTITAKEVMQIEDSDQRTIAISMLKPAELLKQLNAKIINTGSEGTKLYECQNFMGTGVTEYCMWMKDASTPREFIEFVPPEIGKQHDAVFAQASAFGIPVEDYLLISDRG
jgi:hypothetical protein